MMRFWSKYKIVFFTPGVLIPHRSKIKWTSENYCINEFSDPENPIKFKKITRFGQNSSNNENHIFHPISYCFLGLWGIF